VGEVAPKNLYKTVSTKPIWKIGDATPLRANDKPVVDTPIKAICLAPMIHTSPTDHGQLRTPLKSFQTDKSQIVQHCMNFMPKHSDMSASSSPPKGFGSRFRFFVGSLSIKLPSCVFKKMEVPPFRSTMPGLILSTGDI